jgi:hypothetical protein
MLVYEKTELHYIRDIINSIFCTSNKGVALSLIEDLEVYLNKVIGTRSHSGVNAYNSNNSFQQWVKFENEDKEDIDEDEFTTAQINRLERLELETEDDLT